MADINSFMSTFYGPTHEYVHQLDPLSTFDITLKFFPRNDADDENKSSFLNSLMTSAASMAGNALNSATGGLAAAIGGSQNASLNKQHDSYEKKREVSFVDYLIAATMLGSNDTTPGNAFKSAIGLSGSPAGLPVLNLTEFVQDITVPFIGQHGNDESTTLFGKFLTNGGFIVPDNNNIILTILNTKLPIIEYIFYPWMREVTLPYWSYKTQPYSTATIKIDFSKHMDLQYVFCGCRPSDIQTIQPNNVVDGSQLKRQVTLIFDFMFILSDKMKIQPDALDLLKQTGTELLGGASGMFGI